LNSASLMRQSTPQRSRAAGAKSKPSGRPAGTAADERRQRLSTPRRREVAPTAAAGHLESKPTAAAPAEGKRRLPTPPRREIEATRKHLERQSTASRLRVSAPGASGSQTARESATSTRSSERPTEPLNKVRAASAEPPAVSAARFFDARERAALAKHLERAAAAAARAAMQQQATDRSAPQPLAAQHPAASSSRKLFQDSPAVDAVSDRCGEQPSRDEKRPATRSDEEKLAKAERALNIAMSKFDKNRAGEKQSNFVFKQSSKLGASSKALAQDEKARRAPLSAR